MQLILMITAALASSAAIVTIVAVVIAARLHKAKMRKQQPWYSVLPEIAMENYYAYWEKQAGDSRPASNLSNAA